MNIAVLGGYHRPPTRVPFNPVRQSFTRGTVGGFLNVQPALGAAGCDSHAFH